MRRAGHDASAGGRARRPTPTTRNGGATTQCDRGADTTCGSYDAANDASPGAADNEVLLPIHSPLLRSLGIRDRQTLGWVQTKAPALLAIALQPWRAEQAAAAAEASARAHRVGREAHASEGLNYGPSIRQETIRDHRGRTLRAPDVEVSHAADVADPNRLIRRARRSDPLRALLQEGTIAEHWYAAAERLRDDLALAEAAMPAGTLPASSTPGWGRLGLNERQLKARQAIRHALASIDVADRLTMLWLAAGGSILGLARARRCRQATIQSSLCAALAALAKHYCLGPTRRTA